MKTIKIGDKFKEEMTPFPGKFFDWEYEVVGFTSEPYGEFANCKRKHPNGKTEPVGISVELLQDGVFYVKAAN